MKASAVYRKAAEKSLSERKVFAIYNMNGTHFWRALAYKSPGDGCFDDPLTTRQHRCMFLLLMAEIARDEE
jgi:hypothetical protein